MIREDDVVIRCAVREPPNPFAAADVFGLVFAGGVDVEGDGVADAHDHGDSIEVSVGWGSVAENEGTIRADELRRRASNGCGNVKGFDFLRLDNDGEERSLGSIGSAKDGSDGEDFADLIVAELKFGAPAGFGGPIGNELLLVCRWGRRWRRRGFARRWRRLRLRLSELWCERDQNQQSKKQEKWPRAPGGQEVHGNLTQGESGKTIVQK